MMGRCAGVNRPGILGGVAARSGGRRDGEWGGDPDPSTGSGTGRMVDKDMATLRRRIREARAALSEDDDDIDADADVGAPPVPGRWMALERRQRHVAGVHLLETFLMNARQWLGAGVLALLLLGVPATVVFLVGAKLIQAVDAVSSVVNGR